MLGVTEPTVSVRSGRLQNPILLYDGVCGLCNRSVQFILRHDRAGVFRFASLQSNLAASILTRHGLQPERLDTVYLVLHYESPGESLLARSDAVVSVLKRLGGIWGPLGIVFNIFPRALRDWMYRLVARHRYQMFGKYDACPVPTAETRARFLDL